MPHIICVLSLIQTSFDCTNFYELLKYVPGIPAGFVTNLNNIYIIIFVTSKFRPKCVIYTYGL